MQTRRTNTRTVLSRLGLIGVLSIATTQAAASDPGQRPGFRPHFMRQGDGRGGWVVRRAECQQLRFHQRGWSVGFGVTQMDNGEVVLLGMCDVRKSLWYGAGTGEQTFIAFSKDRGGTWTSLDRVVDGAGHQVGRPIMLANLGRGHLSYIGGMNKRYISSDYGRTWTGPARQPCARGGRGGAEGRRWVGRGPDGRATRMAMLGLSRAGKPPGSPTFYPGLNFIRWSDDGGRTWRDEVRPPNWRASEGSLVRAKNGWLVAALRTQVPVAYTGAEGDEYRCLRVSISRDEGKTWTEPKPLADGRMHPNLLRMPNGDLVMTLVVRHDLKDGRRVSHRKGCEAVISRDNGLTWDLGRKIILDEWQFYDHHIPGHGQAGHLFSALLDDGSILTVHNNYLTMGLTLIRWKP